MTERVEKFVTDLKQLSNQLSEMRDYYWLDIDRSSDADRQKGILFDEKFEKVNELFQKTEKSVCKFLEDAFNDPEREARKKAIKLLYEEFPNFKDWNEDAKNALIEKYTKDLLKANTLKAKPLKASTKPVDENLGFSKRKIFAELQNLTILTEANVFSNEFMEFYNSLDQTSSTHNSQKFIVRNYLLENGYDAELVNSIKGRFQKSKPSRLIVSFSDGTDICGNSATKTLTETINKIGVEKVIGLNLTFRNAPYISNDRELMRNCASLNNGYLVNTHSSSITKKKQLEEISQKLNLNLKINIIEV